jgi:hypothetical protein
MKYTDVLSAMRKVRYQNGSEQHQLISIQKMVVFIELEKDTLTVQALDDVLAGKGIPKDWLYAGTGT